MKSSISSGAFSASTASQPPPTAGFLGSRMSLGQGTSRRRGGQSSETPFPNDIPVIGWVPRDPSFRLSAEEAQHNMEQQRLKTMVSHQGWLFKRAQVTLDSKRWYVLENSRLYTFMRENYLAQDEGNVDTNCWQFPGCIRSIIDLEGSTVNVISKQKLLLEIHCEAGCSWSKKGNLFSDLGSGVSGSAKQFTFYAEDDTSFQSWVDALSRAEAYKKLKLQLPSVSQPRPPPLTLWDLPRESLLRIFCRMQDDKPDFKFFEKKWPALREEDVMYYRRVVLLLNGSHQRAIDRHKQVALQEWEVNNSWKEVYEHITLNKLTSEPVIEVEYPRLELKLPSEDSTVVMKVKERMEIFADYKALPRIWCQFLKEVKEFKIELLSSNQDIEKWLSSIEPFIEKFTESKLAPASRSKKQYMQPSLKIKPSEEEVEFAKSHSLRAVEIVDHLLAKLGSALLLEDGPIADKNLFAKLYNCVIIKLIDAQQNAGLGEPILDDYQRETAMDIDVETVDQARSNSPGFDTEFNDDTNVNKAQERIIEKELAQAPELFADWEGGAEEVESLTHVSFLVKMHEIANFLLKCEVVLQSYFDRVAEVLLDKSSEEVKGFRPSTMKKEEHVQHLPINGHVQTVAYRSLKSKNGDAPRPDNVVRKVFSFITVGSFSAHALKFKHGKGYDGDFLKLSERVQALDNHISKLYSDSELLLRALNGDESPDIALERIIDETYDNASSAGIVGTTSARLKKKLDKVVSGIWKIFSPGSKGDVSIPTIVKDRENCEKRRSMSISQALAAFAEVIMSQIKTFYHGSTPDFWYILDLIGAFTITVSCLVSVYEAEMGMVDDTYNACRWVIDRRLMIRLKLMSSSMHTEQESDFFWTLCEDSDGVSAKSRKREGDATAPYKVLFRNFPCEKSEAAAGPCACRVCKSHPLPIWDERADEEYPQHFHHYRAKSLPSDFLQPVLVIHIRKKYWDKIPKFVLDPSDPTHLRFDYPLFPIFNNVGINETQLMAAKFSPQNFLIQNRVNMDAAAVFTSIQSAVEHNAKVLSPDTASTSVLQSSEVGKCPQSLPILIFKKLRPPSKSAGRGTLLHADCIEDPPVFDDDRIAAAARWPSILDDNDSQQLLNRLHAQIIEACTKCKDACMETRKTVKEAARKKLQKVVSRRKPLGAEEDVVEDPGENSAAVVKRDATASPVANSNAMHPSTTLPATVTSGGVDTHSQLEIPPIEQLEVIGDISRSMMSSGRIVMCKSAKDRTSMYVTFEECRVLQEEHDPHNSNNTKKEFMELVQRMRTDGTRIHNVRKNVHTSTYAFNRVQGAILPVNYRPPASRMAWGVQS